ncbi:sulfotransferase 1C4-like [Diaphorina citri]|uniref:Sulfotransferase 1C4-like n=1 Tax=Diaphorina citri TaxID=121845 RepID=A0A3Q0JEM9_DIACI|nr:sulfotransferase 1C4-like [Diaphorina citri]
MVLDFEPISGQSTDGTRILNTQFISPFRTGYVRCKGVCMPEYYVNFAEDIINMDVRDDDVWVCSFPKTGTTWTQEMVWCIANNLDFDKISKNPWSNDSFPMLSIHQDLKSIIQQTGKFLDHPLSTPDILQLEDHLSFESMKENQHIADSC